MLVCIPPPPYKVGDALSQAKLREKLPRVGRASGRRPYKMKEKVSFEQNDCLGGMHTGSQTSAINLWTLESGVCDVLTYHTSRLQGPYVLFKVWWHE